RTEKEQKLPADVLSAMHAGGLFHMLLPVSLGGGAADLVTFNQVIETIAAATKTSGGGLGSATVLRDNAVIQSGVARATGGLQSGRQGGRYSVWSRRKDCSATTPRRA